MCARRAHRIARTDRHLAVDVAGREGLEKGRLVLLVPADDTSLATHWPLARVVSVSGTRSADLEFVRGDESACGIDGCTAVVL